MSENAIKLESLDSSHSKRRVFIMPWAICALGALYYCYEYLLRITPSVITQELMHVYHLTATEIGVFSAYYYHAYVPMQIVVGLLMDRYGPRRLLSFACLLCAFGTFLFANNYSLPLAEAGRFMVGFGSAFAFVGALKLATIWLPPNRFALISGLITCLGMLGAMMGDIVLRALVNQLDWKVTVYGSAGIGVILAFILWIVIRDSSTKVHFHNETLHFGKLFAGLWQALKNPQIWLNGMIGLLLYISLSAFAELWGIQYLEQAHQLSKTNAAYANSLIFLGWAIGGPFWGWLSDFIKLRRLPILVSSCVAFVSISVVLYTPALSVINLYLLLFAFGFFSSVQILIFAVAHESSHLKIAGTTIALTNMMVMMGGNVFQPVIGKLLDLNWAGTIAEGVRIYTPQAYQFALSILPLGILLSIIITLFLRETFAKINRSE